MTDENTSAEVASIAARGLVHPEKLTLDEIQAVCASALTQTDARPDADDAQQGEDQDQSGDDQGDGPERLS